MNNTIKFFVDTKNSGKRLDVFLSENMKEFTRSFLKKLISNKKVKIDNLVVTSPSTKVKLQNQILINTIEKKTYRIAPKKILLIG